MGVSLGAEGEQSSLKQTEVPCVFNVHSLLSIDNLALLLVAPGPCHDTVALTFLLRTLALNQFLISCQSVQAMSKYFLVWQALF